MHPQYVIIFLILIFSSIFLVSINYFTNSHEYLPITPQVKYFSKDIGPRPAGSENERQAAQYLASQMTSYGVETQIQNFKYYSLNSKGTKQSQNVVGTIDGVSSNQIIICADLDTVKDGMYGNYTEGANDDASSLALILALAKKYGKEKPYLTVKLIAFGASEDTFTFPVITQPKTCLKPEAYYKINYIPYLVGARWYVLTHQEEIEKTAAVISLEAIGAGTPCFVSSDAFNDNNPLYVNFLVNNARMHGINAQKIDFVSFKDELGEEGAISHVYLPFAYANVPSTFLTCMKKPDLMSPIHNAREIPDYLTVNDTYENLVKINGNEEALEQHLQMVLFVIYNNIDKLSAVYSMNNYF